MQYREIIPSPLLKPYVKNIYIYESFTDKTFSDTVFPSGCVEIVFNLGAGEWQVLQGNKYMLNPAVELWGQITSPLKIKSAGKHAMLGVRFYPHAAAYFLNDKIDLFNNAVADLQEFLGNEVSVLYALLQENASWQNRIALIESFLLKRLSIAEKNKYRLSIVGNAMNELVQPDFFDNIENVAGRFGVSSRYLQKLFLEFSGLTPKQYSKINRFQNSLKLMTQSKKSLTAIAYDCGYFDQSHFIREFKSFTGSTPSDYILDPASINIAFANN